MPSTSTDKPDALRDARRELEICNACRYCEGFCAVFPAMMRRREFSDAELSYLANLCHNCKGCFYACQYAPPHEFGVNLPQTLARVRADSYQEYAWPQPLAGLYRRNGLLVSLATAVITALVFGLLMAVRGDVATQVHTGPGAFYAVIPWAVMAGAAGASLLFSMLALSVGAARFWRSTGGGKALVGSPLAQAAHNALMLRYLGGGHDGADGCNDLDEGFSQSRRRFHHFLFYGFALCFASTVSGWAYDTFLDWPAPYPFLSAPVIFGTVGGIGMVIGSGGLFWIKVVSDPAPNARRVLGADYALLGLLFMTAATGLLLLVLRSTPAMGAVLAVHLGFVLSLFLLIPYSKMVHGLYRSLALLRDALEKRQAEAAKARPTKPRFVVTRSARPPS